ncbi:hypothetical protein KY290_027668 [Solanum tuberosum]|uniref:Uncharacterized protein n=1 Tax=Solanum tuberosum TaxID=4113 RepID=A0ABQ7UFP0_SOLTU|nr:hypothetical protein KY289_026853 [Solanum tuberosum]KAH0661736.1 hypothetical protein KY284_026667 [Solanum tuberosum]KAH0665431.1 hypothetical protein KY285_026637 [Solanum tuberosum]KAH0748436.1 hypothetical protein KY290_027668 [Solanum tuberosum]
MTGRCLSSKVVCFAPQLIHIARALMGGGGGGGGGGGCFSIYLSSNPEDSEDGMFFTSLAARAAFWMTENLRKIKLVWYLMGDAKSAYV